MIESCHTKHSRNTRHTTRERIGSCHIGINHGTHHGTHIMQSCHMKQPEHTSHHTRTEWGEFRQNMRKECRSSDRHIAIHCNALQYTATHCNALQRTATHCNALQRTATHCNALQRTAMHCNALQRTATHRNALLGFHFGVPRWNFSKVKQLVRMCIGTKKRGFSGFWMALVGCEKHCVTLPQEIPPQDNHICIFSLAHRLLESARKLEVRAILGVWQSFWVKKHDRVFKTRAQTRVFTRVLDPAF